MDVDIIEKAQVYAARREMHLAGRLGFGIHGIVFALEGNGETGEGTEGGNPAREIHGMSIESLVRGEAELRRQGHSQAGAWERGEISEEIWEERAAKWASEFGADWSKAQAILSELEDFGIYMLDPSPSNIRFR